MFPVQLGVQMKNRSSHCAHNADRPYFWRITDNSDVTRLGKGCRQYFRNEGEGRLKVKSRLPSCKILLKSNSACAAECDAPIPPMSSQSELVGRISVARSGPDCCRRGPGCRLENSEPRKPRSRFRCLG